MPLSSVVVDERLITPRGGPAGTNVSVPGSGFGVQPGLPPAQVRVDPLGENVLAVIVSWAPNLVVFTAPVLAQVNRIVNITLQLAGGVDSYTFPFWYPALGAPTIDYQWPNAEAGSPDENEDDPRIFTAADFNRIRDSIDTMVPPVVPRQYAVLQENPAGIRVMALLPEFGLIGGYRTVANTAARDAIPADMRVLGMLVRVHDIDKIYVLKTGLTNADWVELTTGGGSGGGDITDSFTGSVTNGQTVFTLSVNPDPARLSSVKFFINGVKYTKDHGAFTLGGPGNKTLTWIAPRPTLKPTDKVEADYPPE